MRDDLAEAHRLAWEHIARPGSWWTGAERVELASTAMLALADPDPLPPWVACVGEREASRRAGRAGCGTRLRLSAGAPRRERSPATCTTRWPARSASCRSSSCARSCRPSPPCGTSVATSACLCRRCRHRSMASRQVGGPTRLAPAQLNWVPVAAPADRGGGGRAGIHRRARRAGQHMADGRRPVHARCGDGRPSVDAPTGGLVASADGARRRAR